MPHPSATGEERLYTALQVGTNSNGELPLADVEGRQVLLAEMPGQYLSRATEAPAGADRDVKNHRQILADGAVGDRLRRL
jgi:hypothetical protein